MAQHETYCSWILLGLLVAGMAGLFALDALAPPGVADGIGYPILLMLCIRLPWRNALTHCAWISTLLTGIGVLFSSEGGIGFEASMVNRVIAFISIWIMYFLLERRLTLEDELRASEESALSASQAKSNFLANITRELRTPVAEIVSRSAMVAKAAFGPVGDPRYRSSGEDIHSSASNLLVIINDILDMTRLESGRYKLEERYHSLVDLVTDALQTVASSARHAGIELKTQIPERLPPLRVDRRAIKQILANLLSNAIKFTHEGGKITVAIEEGADGIVLSVGDNGRGIPKVQLPRLAIPFAQVMPRERRTQLGTGLGLALCRSLAELHGGKLEIESIEGQGTTVRLRLPKERIFPGRAIAAVPAPDAVAGGDVGRRA
jgi:signal transduction histidine kinase